MYCNIDYYLHYYDPTHLMRHGAFLVRYTRLSKMIKLWNIVSSMRVVAKALAKKKKWKKGHRLVGSISSCVGNMNCMGNVECVSTIVWSRMSLEWSADHVSSTDGHGRTWCSKALWRLLTIGTPHPFSVPDVVAIVPVIGYRCFQ